MTEKSTLLKNTMILAFGKFSSQFITFLMLPLYTAYLSPSEYGIVDLVVTYVALLAPAITFQLEMAAFRFLIDARQDEALKTKIISNSLQIIFTALIPALLIAIVVEQLFDISYFYLIVCIVLVNVFSGFSLQSARGLGKNLNFAIASILIGATTVASNIVLVIFLHMGSVGILLSMLIAQSDTFSYCSFKTWINF